MEGLSLLWVVTHREQTDAYMAFLRENDLSAIFTLPCNGTARQSLLDVLGIERTAKILFLTMTSTEKAARLMHGMERRLGIDMAGNGIAVSLPVGSIGGASCMKYLTEHQDIIIDGRSSMSERQTYPYSLLVAIAERGSSDTVMDAARSAGAGGGTVVHAKGTATEFTQKFFGISIAAEKEIVFIVTRAEQKNDIMRAIIEKAGMRTEARAAVFSLPVDGMVGLASLMKPEAEE